MQRWWHRQRIWVALLLPCLALGLAASSFRLWNLYLPWEWSRPVMANGTTGTLTQDYVGTDDVARQREVTVTVDAVQVTEARNGVEAVPGADLWVVGLTFTAEPDQILDICTVELLDDRGDRYSAGWSGKVSTTDEAFWGAQTFSCVPEDTPGPRLVFDTLEEAAVPRPPSWSRTATVAMPEGVTPASLRIGWLQPDYLVLDLPE